MSDTRDITSHYSSGTLLGRLRAAFAQDGADPDHPDAAALAPYDQFHGRGLEATEEIAASLGIGANDHVLDIGSGIGGPARYFARLFGCRVTGIDLTAEFCEVARHLTRQLGLDERVRFECGDALAMPFADASFTAAYSMNVSMNIADRKTLYAEIRRVLRPGGSLALSELARGPGPEPQYPTPWAASAHASFLATPEATRRGLEEAGFEVRQFRSTVEEALAFAERSRALVARGEKPPHRAVMLLHGAIAKQAMANTARGLAQSSIMPIEVLCRRLP